MNELNRSNLTTKNNRTQKDTAECYSCYLLCGSLLDREKLSYGSKFVEYKQELRILVVSVSHRKLIDKWYKKTKKLNSMV
jgi:hypothetical protein